MTWQTYSVNGQDMQKERLEILKWFDIPKMFYYHGTNKRNDYGENNIQGEGSNFSTLGKTDPYVNTS